MKNQHLKLILGSFLLILVLLTLYFKSENTFSEKHQAILNSLQDIQDRESAIAQDILKANSLLLPSYDTIVENQNFLAQVCPSLKEGDLRIYKAYSANLDQAVNSYCEFLVTKIDLIESFKMKQAVVRNSMQYIFREESSLFLTHPEKGPLTRDTHLMQELVQATYSYYFVPSPASSERLRRIHAEAEKSTEFNLARPKNQPSSQALGFLLSHSKAVLRNAADLHILVNSLVQKNTMDANALQTVYMQEYEKSLSTSRYYRALLLLSCFALLGCMVYFLSRLWKTTEALEKSNADLESRVSARTRDLEASLQTVNEQQEALVHTSKMSALGEMAGGVAHEINTPLAIIGLNAEIIGELLNEENFEKKMVMENLETIQLTVARAARIINGLRRFSRDGSQDPAVLVPIEVLFHDVLSLCAEKFKTHGVNLEMRDHDKTLKVLCRSTEICQVILNLLNNSFDAIQDLPEKWVRLESYREETGIGIVIAVTDSGPGLSSTVREKLFQPFFTTKEIGKGTGLGLSISVGIAKAHGGNLIYDETSLHTRFLLQLCA